MFLIGTASPREDWQYLWDIPVPSLTEGERMASPCWGANIGGTLRPRTTMVCRWCAAAVVLGGPHRWHHKISPGLLVQDHWWSEKLTGSATTMSVPELHDSWWLATWHDSCRKKRRFLSFRYPLNGFSLAKTHQSSQYHFIIFYLYP